jgi:predicted enzyme related to lactoylglutathione lyase
MNTECNPVGWFEIYVQDMDRAKTFYEKTLQVTLQKLAAPGLDPALEMWAFPMQEDKPGATGSLVKMEGKDSGCGGTVIYFSCEDCAVESDRAVENGGKLVKEKFSIGPFGFISFVEDTEGNMIGLHSCK